VAQTGSHSAYPLDALGLATPSFAALFEGMPDAVVLADPERRIVAANPAAERIFGYSTAEMRGHHTRMLYADPADYEAQGRKRFNPLGPKTTGVHDIEYRRKSGETFPGETTGSVIRDAAGEVLGYLGIVRDVTEQRRTQDVLQRLYAISADQTRSNAQKIQAILELGAAFFDMPLGIVSAIAGDTYTVLYAQAPDGAVAPGDSFALSGTYCVHTLHADDVTGFHHVAESAIATHPCYANFGLEAYLGIPLWVDGERFGTLNYADWQPHRPFTDGDDELVRLFAQWISNELSRGRAFAAASSAREAADAARAEAESANAAKSQFLATLSHDLRTPFTGLLGMLDLLDSSGLDPEQQAYLAHARSSARALLDLLNDTLDLSKIEAGRMTFESAPFDLVDVIRGVAGLFRPTANNNGVDLTVAMAPDCPSTVRGDAVRVRQILTNLVGNAVKFTREGEVRIEVNGDGPDEGITLTVSDTGPGIDPGRQARIFEPFEQAETATTRNYGGTGLGLTICKRLVEGMGGRLALDSTPGAGSRFTLDLPLPATAPAQAQEVPTPEADLTHGRPMAILVAEDNAVNALLLRTMLEREGHSVQVVADGASAIAAAQAQHFDVAIFDMHMPRVDGLTSTRRIRAGAAQDPNLPVVALTADVVGQNRERANDAGLSAFLTKPIDWAELGRTLAAVVPSAQSSGGGAPEHGQDGAFADVPLYDTERGDGLKATIGAAKYGELLDALLDTLSDERTRMAELHTLPADATKAALHTLKGVALNYGARRLGACCAEAESAAQAGELTPAWVDMLTATLDATLAHLREHRAEACGDRG